MKRLIFLFLLFLFSFESVNACEVYITPLRKNFRSAEQVFLGDIVSVQKKIGNDVPQNLDSVNSKYSEVYLLKLRITQSWKKAEKNKIITIYSENYCLCPHRRYDFQVGDKLLAFVDKYQKLETCNIYSKQLGKRFVEENKISSSYLEEAEKDIKRLDNFRFRLWARIYPF